MKNRSKYIAAAAQLGPINPEDSKESVISRMLNLLVEAKAHETKLVVFPELCLTTFFPRYYITDQAKLDNENMNKEKDRETQIAVAEIHAGLTSGKNENDAIAKNRELDIKEKELGIKEQDVSEKGRANKAKENNDKVKISEDSKNEDKKLKAAKKKEATKG